MIVELGEIVAVKLDTEAAIDSLSRKNLDIEVLSNRFIVNMVVELGCDSVLLGSREDDGVGDGCWHGRCRASLASLCSQSLKVVILLYG